MKAEQGEFESLASFYRVCDGRASYHQTVSLDAVQLFKFLELLYEGLFVRLGRAGGCWGREMSE